MGIGQEWATEANAPPVGSSLHISGTRNRGYGRIDFWMFTSKNRRTDGERSKVAPMRCGQCKDVIPMGVQHCPHCWGEEE